ncbi:MAG: hypothetical protein Q8936_08055 [Bacillota bacterium]|nr:hypothetical protein [Bacillota bacterium]
MGRVNEIFLSEVLYKKVYSENNEFIGKLLDIYVLFNGDYPVIVGCKVSKCGSITNYRFENINFIRNNNELKIIINGRNEMQTRRFMYALSKHLLDRQIVDVNGKKLVRVNDLRIAKIAGDFRVVAVDTGITALGRRLGVDGIIKSLYRAFSKIPAGKLIMWDNIKSLEVVNDYLKLSVPYKKLLVFQPTDLTDILERININYQ